MITVGDAVLKAVVWWCLSSANVKIKFDNQPWAEVTGSTAAGGIVLVVAINGGITLVAAVNGY